MIDPLIEVADSLRTHKMRTALAVLTVAWGIFMLVLLLGAGRGIQNGVELQFKDDAVNSIRIYGGKTTIAHNGLPRGRSIRYSNEDYRQIRGQVDHVDKITARYFARNTLVSYGGQQAAFDIRGVHPDHLFLEKTIISSGRYLNEMDLAERRKVCVIGAQVVARLFGETSTDPVGEFITLGDTVCQVVGAFTDVGSRREEEVVYLPVSTAQLLFGKPDRVDQLLYTVGEVSYEESKESEQQVRELLAKTHNFSPQDNRAARIYNNLDEYKKISDLFYWVRVFVAVVGVGTVLTGILAVSNIMVISVSERRREIGIRKAIGATPGSITRLIVLESVILTSVAGYIGLFASIGLLELLKATVPENEYMYQPDVNTFVVFSVTLLVIVSGTLAGYLPARRAAVIDPVEALQPS